MRERVAGTSVEEDGEDVDGAGRELIVVVARWRGDDVTGGIGHGNCHMKTPDSCCVCSNIFFWVGRKGRKEQGLEVVVIDSCYPIVPFSFLLFGVGVRHGGVH